MRGWKLTGGLILALGSMAVLLGHRGVDVELGSEPGITIYTDDLGLVRVTLDRMLGGGRHTVRVDGLPTNLETTSLIVLNENVTLEGAHGFRTYRGAVGSGASIDLELIVEGSVERLELAFLTSGLGWSAVYNMIVGPDDASARFDAYAMLANNSGATYEAARVQLLAGSIWRGGQFEADVLRTAAVAAREAVEQPGIGSAAFAGYHLYTLEERVTLRAGESRHVRLLGASSAPVEKQFTFTAESNYYQPTAEPLARPVLMAYRVPRSDETEFGRTPLPQGAVRIYQPDAEGRLQLLGIASIENTPAGEELLLPTGYAFDIRGTRTQTDYRRVAENTFEAAWRVELRNETDQDVAVQVIERLSGDWEILESSHPAEKLSASMVRFRVPVAADGASVLEYRVRIRV